MKKLLALTLCFLSYVSFAQIVIKEDSFQEVVGFVNINTEKMYDDNDQPYAVVKVKTENIDNKQRHELVFEGDARTFFELEYKVGEVWLYISYYATYLKISHPDFGSTEYWFPQDLEPKKGYELTIYNKPPVDEEILNRIERLENANIQMYENQNVATTSSVGNGLIKKRGDFYYYEDKRLTKFEYKELLKDCPEAWAKYKKSKSCYIWGCVPIVGIIGCVSYSLLPGQSDVKWAMATAGGCALISTTLFIVGTNNKKNAYKEYNKHCANQGTLSIGMTPCGLSVCLNF